MTSEFFNVYELLGEQLPQIPGHRLILSQSAPESLREQASLPGVYQNLGHDGGRVSVTALYALPDGVAPGGIDDALLSDEAVLMKCADKLGEHDLALRLFPRVRFSSEVSRSLTPVLSGKIIYGQSGDLVTCRGADNVGHPVLVAEKIMRGLTYSVHINLDPVVLGIPGGLMEYIFSQDPNHPDELIQMMRAVCNEQFVTVASREFTVPLIDSCLDVFSEWHREDILEELVKDGILIWTGDRYELQRNKIEVNAYECFQTPENFSMTRVSAGGREHLSRLLFPRADSFGSGGHVYQDRFRNQN